MLLVGGIFVAAVVAMLLFVYVAKNREIEQAGLARAETLNRMAFEALYASMRQGGGREGNRRVIERLRQLGAFTQLRVVKGTPVVRQFGASPDELPRDELERRGLKGEEVRDVQWKDGYRVIRYVTPLRVRAECQRCHHAAVGDINGVISAEISLRGYESAWRHERNVLLSGLAASLLALGLITFFGLRELVIRPLQTIQEGVAAVAEGNLNQRLEVYTGDELEILAREFNRMAFKLQESYAHLEDKVAERTRELRTLNQIAATVNSSLNLEETLPEVLQQVIDLTGADAADLRLLEQGQLHVRYTRGLPADFIPGEEKLPSGECMCFLASQDGQSRLSNDLERDYPGALPCLRAGFRSGLSVPIWLKGEQVGVLHVASRRKNAFSETTEHLLLAVDHHIGLAVEKARLYTKERNQRHLAETLREASQVLNATLDLEAVLHALLEQLARVLIVDVGLILLREGDMLRVAAVRGRPELKIHRLLGYTLPLTASRDFQQVVEDKSVHTFCQPGRKPPFAEGMRPIEEVDWCMVVPLLRGEDVVGLLALEQLDHCYDDETEPQIAMAFANHAVAAIENARLYAQIVALNAELESRVRERTRELEVARQTLARYADQLRELLDFTIQVQEEERGRIAREIHDGVSQLLVGAMYELQAARLALPTRPDDVGVRLLAAQAILKQAKEEMRRVIYDLYPVVLVESGLVPALETHMREWKRLTSIGAHLAVNGQRRRLPRRVERAVYRIIQEALHNVVQHARAETVWINLEFNAQVLVARVTDNGIGFDPTQEEVSRPHLGLMGMRERAQSVGGTLEIASGPGKGTCVTVTIPLEQVGDHGAEETDHTYPDRRRSSHRSTGVAQPAEPV